MRIWIYLVLIALCSSCSGYKVSQFYFMEGTWKMEGKDKYEIWKVNNPKELKGSVFTLQGNYKNVLETLAIKWVDGVAVYEATVPDQNQGRTIPFTLNKNETTCFSFENATHDFPTKIQYRKINDRRLEVSVLGNDGEGFSYIQVKQ